MADTLKPRPSRRTMLLLLGVLLLGVVAAGWGLWSRIRARHGRDIGWQHLRPASRPAPAAIPASAAPDTVAASATAASPEPSTRPVPDNPPAPEAAAERRHARRRQTRAARVRRREIGAT
jgi:type II secretory pathway component PulM